MRHLYAIGMVVVFVLNATGPVGCSADVSTPIDGSGVVDGGADAIVDASDGATPSCTGVVSECLNQAGGPLIDGTPCMSGICHTGRCCAQ